MGEQGEGHGHTQDHSTIMRLFIGDVVGRWRGAFVQSGRCLGLPQAKSTVLREHTPRFHGPGFAPHRSSSRPMMACGSHHPRHSSPAPSAVLLPHTAGRWLIVCCTRHHLNDQTGPGPSAAAYLSEGANMWQARRRSDARHAPTSQAWHPWARSGI